MASRFQAASLVASPSCPNAVAWSDENLIAVASGHLVTILNPAIPSGPRGLITIPPNIPFSIGLVERTDLLSGELLPTCLSRDNRPCVRSISWSPVGLAPNAGCFLAFCTSEGRVKLYRFPFREFSAEWVEVVDISDMLCTYYTNVEFKELEVPSSESYKEQVSQADVEINWEDDPPLAAFKRVGKRRRHNTSVVINEELGPQDSLNGGNARVQTAIAEVKLFNYSKLQKGSSVEVLTVDGNQRSWVTGMLDQLDGTRAHVIFPTADGNGKTDKWVEINPQFGDHSDNDENLFPKIRPSMNMSNFPEQMLLDCDGVDKILKAGQVVEAWTNHRWFEGVFLGLNKGSLLVKLAGDSGVINVDASSARLAPVWNKEKQSWQVTAVRIQKNEHSLQTVGEIKSHNVQNFYMQEAVSMPLSRTKKTKKLQDTSYLPFITAAEYSYRSSLLSSLVVAWSPVLQIKSEIGLNPPYNVSHCCSILAVGSKSGRISFWRIHGPQCYSILPYGGPTSALLIGLLQAHKTWVTAISWGLFASDSFNPQLILATGCSDGSVKIWRGYSDELLKSSAEKFASFTLLNEVIDVDSVPVSVLSLHVPLESQNKIFLAVGKGSGALVILIYDISTNKFDQIVQDSAHDHIVTGLAWAFDGRCLYSCSQDDSLHSWIVQENTLRYDPIPLNCLGVKSSTDVPNVFDSCFGLAVSPGYMVIAVARSFDADLLNPMYQARSQKAAVEFFWIGGQKLENISHTNANIDVEAFPDKELIPWGYNILWSLNQYEDLNKSLVVWDIVSALLALKESVPNYVEHILFTWLTSYVGFNYGSSPSSILQRAPQFLSNITSRQLHLLSILSRRVVLNEEKDNNVSRENRSLEGEGCGIEEEKLGMWAEFVESIEKEVRERLVVSSFCVVVNLASQPSTGWHKPGCWLPVGLAQMEKWVVINDAHVKNYLKIVASEVQKLKKRFLVVLPPSQNAGPNWLLNKIKFDHSFWTEGVNFEWIDSVCKYTAEEQCSYCSTSVPFEDAESAYCKGTNNTRSMVQRHKLARCAASMQVCPTSPTWFCVSCQRQVSNFAPESFFTLSKYPTTNEISKTTPSIGNVLSKPLCPFCGILLQRLQPVFLLLPSPV